MATLDSVVDAYIAEEKIGPGVVLWAADQNGDYLPMLVLYVLVAS